ncbi:unnamed protein product [Prorocentrum cordatum]|uniref:Uncharacterized protein n=1 Tax=Prorocentrum cordatum TaxID=2364126 RepID=A0ABN9T2C2_9DINO|nr:unnamed protein product [Polarella glacialis]
MATAWILLPMPHPPLWPLALRGSPPRQLPPFLPPAPSSRSRAAWAASLLVPSRLQLRAPPGLARRRVPPEPPGLPGGGAGAGQASAVAASFPGSTAALPLSPERSGRLDVARLAVAVAAAPLAAEHGVGLGGRPPWSSDGCAAAQRRTQ